MNKPFYADFFGLKDHPFRLTPDTRYFFPSDKHIQILEILSYGVKNREGFMVLVGEPGTGKTMLLRLLLQSLPSEVETAVLLTTNLSPYEIIEAILEDLGLELPYKSNKEILWRIFRDYLLQLAAHGKRLLVVIDEAQNLSLETLEELRLLSNLEGEKDKLLQILLSGQPLLAHKLLSANLYQLFQRITIWEELKGLNREEILTYVNYRLSKAGSSSVILDKRAIKYLHKYTKGFPRLINKIMDRSLLLMAAENQNILSPKILKEALATFGPPSKSKFRNLFDKISLFYLHYACFLFG